MFSFASLFNCFECLTLKTKRCAAIFMTTYGCRINKFCRFLILIRWTNHSRIGSEKHSPKNLTVSVDEFYLKLFLAKEPPIAGIAFAAPRCHTKTHCFVRHDIKELSKLVFTLLRIHWIYCHHNRHQVSSSGAAHQATKWDPQSFELSHPVQKRV